MKENIWQVEGNYIEKGNPITIEKEKELAEYYDVLADQGIVERQIAPDGKVIIRKKNGEVLFYYDPVSEKMVSKDMVRQAERFLEKVVQDRKGMFLEDDGLNQATPGELKDRGH